MLASDLLYKQGYVKCLNTTITIREVEKWVMPTFIKISVCDNVQ